MIELMKQLQAWADDASYDWENYAFRGCKHKDQIIRMAERFDAPLRYVKDVLDGLIQVWRPVEHYKPKDDEPVFLYAPNVCKEGLIGYYRSDDGEFHEEDEHRNVMTLIFPTHWMPLPACPEPPKKA